mgnify:CR=1 FL=1
MKKLKKIQNDFDVINSDEMSTICGGKSIAEDTINYCYVIETTEANDSNWNCSDASTAMWQDGIPQGTLVVYQQP